MNYRITGDGRQRQPGPNTPKALLAAVVATALASGCAVGPNYHRPTVQTPATFRDLNDKEQVQVEAASFADLPWWQVFADPQLQELIRIAIRQNYDLQLATERINTARAQVAITRSRLFPQVEGNGDFSGGKLDTSGTAARRCAIASSVRPSSLR